MLRIAYVVAKKKVPPELIFNCDQTAVHFVPTNKRQYAKKGSKTVTSIGADDKRCITAHLCCSMSGAMLPPQLVFGGKSAK